MWPAFIRKPGGSIYPRCQQDAEYNDFLINQSIDPTTRGFVPSAYHRSVLANQSAVIKIMDAAPNAVVIRVNVVQADESSKYVYVVKPRE